MSTWDRRFLLLAQHIAGWSKDPSTKCGAVIIRPDRTICSVGFNGFPKGMHDGGDLYHNREVKYDRVVHCEMNAILFTREPLHGYTLYTWPFLSCSRCAVHVIQSGIKRVVAPICPPDQLSRWEESLKKSRSYFKEAGVEVVELYP